MSNLYGMLLHQAGEVYAHYTEGNRLDDIRKAINYYSNALKIFTPDKPRYWQK